MESILFDNILGMNIWQYFLLWIQLECIVSNQNFHLWKLMLKVCIQLINILGIFTFHRWEALSVHQSLLKSGRQKSFNSMKWLLNDRYASR